MYQLRNPCEFQVWRDERESDTTETIDFLDVFISTVNYGQSALKRTDTVRLFQQQLESIIAQSHAHVGLILNHHANFDALGGYHGISNSNSGFTKSAHKINQSINQTNKQTNKQTKNGFLNYFP